VTKLNAEPCYTNQRMNNSVLGKKLEKKNLTDCIKMNLVANNRKRTLSDLSSSSSSTDSDENDNMEFENDKDDSSSSESCSSSSSDSDSSESSSDSSDCDPENDDDDNGDDDDDDEDDDDEDDDDDDGVDGYHFNSDKSQQGGKNYNSSANHNNKACNNMSTRSKQTLFDDNKEENWGFAAVAKTQSRNIFSNANQAIVEEKKLKKPNQTFQNDNNATSVHDLLKKDVKATGPSTSTSTGTGTATGTSTGAGAGAGTEKKKIVPLKSMPLEKFKNGPIDDDEDTPFLTEKTIIKYQLMENIEQAKSKVEDREIVEKTEKYFRPLVDDLEMMIGKNIF